MTVTLILSPDFDILLTMKAHLKGVTLHYAEQGMPSGTPVIFLHGFPFSHEMWDGQLETVGQEYRAIAYDLRGHGYSDIGDGQYTIEGHVDDLLALMDHLAVWRAVIVGLSMGGYIALRAMERNPERFRAVVLCDTRSEADSNEGKLRRFAAIQAVKSEGSGAFADTFVKMVFSERSLQDHPEAVGMISRIIRRTPPLSIAGTLLALASRTDTTGSLENFSVPCLIMVGEHDVTTPPTASQAMHERIHDSELVIVPAAAHMSNLENPEVFNHHLLAFLRRAVPPGT